MNSRRGGGDPVYNDVWFLPGCSDSWAGESVAKKNYAGI